MNKIYQKPLPGSKNAGFTLIELLVVVLIIGILSAVALPQYQTAVEKARFTEIIVLSDSLFKAQQVAYLEEGSWPASWDVLSVEPPAGGTVSYRGTHRYPVMTYPNGNAVEMNVSGGVYGYTERNQYSVSSDGTRLCCWERANARAEKVCKSMAGEASSFNTGCSFGNCTCRYLK